jgi:hypothetical protein
VSDLVPGRPDRAIAVVLGAEAPAPNRVAVDLSRFTTNRVVVEFHDFDRLPAIGDEVTAVDFADQREAPAEVLGINTDSRTVALVVDWTRIRDIEA